MLSISIRRAVLGSILLVLLLAAAPASAEVRQGSFDFELYGGWYAPGPSAIPGAPTVGGRFGYNVTQRFFVQGTLGYANFESSVSDGTSFGTATVDLWNLDFSFGYNFVVEGKVTPEVHAGFGGGFSSIGGDVQINDPTVCGTLTCSVTFANLSEDSFTLNGGAGVRIDLSDLIYLRPVIQVRWFTARDADQWDAEYSLALGFKFGGN